MNGGVTSRWWRHDLRRRPVRMLTVALLVAVGVGLLAAAVAGARRSATVVDRAVEVIRPADGIVVPNEPGFDWGPVAELAVVEDLVTFPVLYFEVDGLEGAIQGFPPAMPSGGRDFERAVVLEGRVADPSRVDEVTISPTVRASGVEVGDELTIDLFSMSEALSGSTDPTRREVRVTVVGVTKLGFFAADVQPTYAFHRAHEDLIVGDAGYVNAIVRLVPGGELAELEREVSRLAGRPVEVLRQGEFIAATRESVAVETIALLALAGAGTVAVFALLGQALARMVSGSRDEIELLGLLGSSRRAATRAALAGAASAVVAGAVAALPVAYAASSFFPIGSGRDVEPDPGRDLDLVVVVATIAASAAVVLGLMVLAARSTGRDHDAADVADDAVTSALRRLPLGLPAMLGARLALGRRPGSGSARAVTWIVASAVVCVVAAATFAVALRDVAHDPAAFGQGYDAGVPVFGPDTALDGLDVLDPARVTRLVNVVDALNGQPVSLVGAEDLVGSFEPVVLRGRAATAADEVALAPETMEVLGVTIGDTVDLAGREADVVGEVLVPELGHTDYTTGGVLSTATLDRLLDGGTEVKFEIVAVDLPAGMDVAEAKRLLDEDLAFLIEPWMPTQRQLDLRPTEPLPAVFAGFVGLLMAGSIGHALATTARQRRHEVAVLQVLGLRRSHVRRTVLWHAGVATAAGCLVGAPVGFLVGRALWRTVVLALPALHQAPPAWAGAVILLLIASVSLVLGGWSAMRTARHEPALVLRTE